MKKRYIFIAIYWSSPLPLYQCRISVFYLTLTLNIDSGTKRNSFINKFICTNYKTQQGDFSPPTTTTKKYKKRGDTSFSFRLLPNKRNCIIVIPIITLINDLPWQRFYHGKSYIKIDDGKPLLLSFTVVVVKIEKTTSQTSKISDSTL